MDLRALASGTFTPPLSNNGIAWPSDRYVEEFNATSRSLNSTVSLGFNPSHSLFVVTSGGFLDQEIQRVIAEVESQRLALVRTSYDAHDRVPFRADLTGLSRTEQEAVRIFAMEVKPLMDRIEARQQHPHAHVLASWMTTFGDYYSQLLFRRFQRDSLAGTFAGKGSLFPFFPDLPPLNGMIDPTISPDEFRELSARLSPHDEILRPTTALVKNGQGITAIPWHCHPDVTTDHVRLYGILRRIANLKIDGPLAPELHTQLLAWAEFFFTGSAKDEARAAQATIDAGMGSSRLRVHLGPSESYWDDNCKFPYVLQVGIRDTRLTQDLQAWADLFPLLEESLTGIEGYTPRRLSTRGGFADPITQVVTGGFVASFQGAEPAGNNFPNYPYPGVEGSNRFILLESLRARTKTSRPALAALLGEEALQGWNSAKAIVQFVTAHESGHLLGPLRDHVTPGGSKMGAVFGAHWGSADEPKADLTIAPLVRILREQNRISPEQARHQLLALLALNLGARYKGKETFFADRLKNHLYGNVLVIAYFVQQKALRFQNGRFTMNYEILAQAAERLWRTIIQYQASGDVEGYLAFARDVVSSLPDDADQAILTANKDNRQMFLERHL